MFWMSYKILLKCMQILWNLFLGLFSFRKAKLFHKQLSHQKLDTILLNCDTLQGQKRHIIPVQLIKTMIWWYFENKRLASNKWKILTKNTHCSCNFKFVFIPIIKKNASYKKIDVPVRNRLPQNTPSPSLFHAHTRKLTKLREFNRTFCSWGLWFPDASRPFRWVRPQRPLVPIYVPGSVTLLSLPETTVIIGLRSAHT